ncbi:lysozyme inhibitor LprI family protein [Novosphingobium fluoreni]|uniref:lysozyme inhibitor LprI family protein n=1 Tax=Novosphingobium fluoreni TaxID=1391222 RepID=UPI0007373CF9|nr:urease [Novosphingobium barchaimii]
MILALILAAATPAPDCRNAMTQADMNICAGQQRESADRALNATWKRASDIARARSRADFNLLLDAQRKWLAYRDAQCVAENGRRGPGSGSMWPMQQSACITGLTQERTKRLRIYIDAPR